MDRSLFFPALWVYFQRETSQTSTFSANLITKQINPWCLHTLQRGQVLKRVWSVCVWGGSERLASETHFSDKCQIKTSVKSVLLMRRWHFRVNLFSWHDGEVPPHLYKSVFSARLLPDAVASPRLHSCSARCTRACQQWNSWGGKIRARGLYPTHAEKTITAILLKGAGTFLLWL